MDPALTAKFRAPNELTARELMDVSWNTADSTNRELIAIELTMPSLKLSESV
jgi:hypothetical protein